MRLVIEIETDNAAFGDTFADRAENAERMIRDHLRFVSLATREERRFRMLDANGNGVGTIDVFPNPND